MSWVLNHPLLAAAAAMLAAGVMSALLSLLGEDVDMGRLTK